MIRRGLRIFVHLTGGLAAGAAILMVAAAWRLSQGPVSLGFLIPTIEGHLNAVHDSFRVRLGDVVVTWAGWERAVDLRFVDVGAVGADGRTLARVPQLAVSLSARALAGGLIAPRRIELFNPSLRLRRDRDGQLLLAFADGEPGSAALVGGFVETLVAPERAVGPMGYLDRVEIVDADLTIEDGPWGTTWRAPSSQARLWREPGGVKAEVLLDLEAGGRRADLVVLGDYRAAPRRLDVGVSFGTLRPASFAGLAPPLRVLDALDVPLRGTLTFSLTDVTAAAAAVEAVGFDIAGDGGHLALPVALAQRLDVLPLAQRVAVDGVELRGRYEGDGARVEIDHLDLRVADGRTIYVPHPLDQEVPVARVSGRGRWVADGPAVEIDALAVDLGPEGSVLFPAPLAHRMPVRSVDLRGRYDGARRRVEVASLTADLHGPRLGLAGAADLAGDDARITAAATLRGLAVDDLRHYWPRAIDHGSYDWSTENLSDGEIVEASVTVGARIAADGGAEVEALNGKMTLAGISVDYLSPMPKVRGADGTARFDRERFVIDITAGHAPGIDIEHGKVRLVGLGSDDERAEIDLALAGPVTDVLSLIDHEPLGYPAKIGIAPAKAGGDATVGLHVGFALLDALALDDIDIRAEAEIDGVRLADAVFDRDILDGSLALVVDEDGMDVTGSVRLETVPGDLVWRENFAADAAFRRRVDVTVVDTDITRASDVGLDLAPFPGKFVTGPLSALLSFTDEDGTRRRFQSSVDLATAELAIPYLGWRKARGVPATAEVDIVMAGERIVDVPAFSVLSEDLAIEGTAGYHADGGLRRIDFSRVAFGRTDVRGALEPRSGGGWDVAVEGPVADLGPLWDNVRAGKLGHGPADRDEGEAEPVSFSVTADVDTVWLGEGRRIDDVGGIFARNGDVWTAIRARGRIGDEGAVEIALAPEPGDARTLTITAADAGAALRTFGIYPSMGGGTLRLDGRFDDTKTERPLAGTVSIEDYRIIDAPALAHVLSMLALTGIVDSLDGDGLGFTTFETGFTVEGGTLTVTDATASGASIGFTASGTVDIDADTLALDGTLVPAYAINSVLGRIPLVGEIFTGGESGGGVFAATYRMTGPVDDPEVSVNPLTALAPGFLRNLFDVSDAEPGAAPPSPIDDGVVGGE